MTCDTNKQYFWTFVTCGIKRRHTNVDDFRLFHSIIFYSSLCHVSFHLTQLELNTIPRTVVSEDEDTFNSTYLTDRVLVVALEQPN